MHASNNSARGKIAEKRASHDYHFSPSAHPFGRGTALAQRLDLLPDHHSPLSAQPLCVHARIAVRSLLEMTDWNDCR